MSSWRNRQLMSEGTANDVAELMAVSRVFSAFYLEGSSESFVRRLIAHDAAAHWPVLSDDERYLNALTKLSHALTAWRPSDTSSLQSEHAELFVGPGPQKAPPWGSVYLSDERLLMGPSTLALERFLKARGIHYVLKENQPLDHIGLCFGILAQLLEQRLGEITGGVDVAAKEAIQTFLHDHFLTWADQCIALQLKHARSEFQNSLASLAEFFLLCLDRSFPSKQCLEVTLLGRGLGETES